VRTTKPSRGTSSGSAYACEEETEKWDPRPIRKAAADWDGLGVLDIDPFSNEILLSWIESSEVWLKHPHRAPSGEAYYLATMIERHDVPTSTMPAPMILCRKEFRRRNRRRNPRRENFIASAYAPPISWTIIVDEVRARSMWTRGVYISSRNGALSSRA